jgi:serine/threonine protein kinase
MICAECAEEVGEDLPRCPLCGGEPLLAGRLRLDAIDQLDALGTTYRATRIADATPLWLRELPFRRGAAGEARAKRDEAAEVSSGAEAELDREARRLAILRHPGLPAWAEHLVHHQGRMGALWLAQVQQPGTALAQVLQQGTLDEIELYRRLESLAGVLAYLHGQSPPVVHGGVSPSSVLELEDGRWLLIGFNAIGSAREIGPTTGSGVQSIARAMAHMAPEQFFGRAEPATDVWGLGLIAIVMLTGCQAIELRDAEHRFVWHERVAIDPTFMRLLDEVLQVDPSKRPSAAEVSDRIAALRRSQLSTLRLPRETLDLGEPRDDRPAPVVGSIRAKPGEADAPRAARPTSQAPAREPRRPSRRSRRSDSNDDVPVMRPADLSRELSRAHHATEQLLERARRQRIAGRVALMLGVALLSAVLVWVLTLR